MKHFVNSKLAAKRWNLDTGYALKKRCFSKLFGYYSCMTFLPMLIQRMQWSNGCKISSEVYTRAVQIQSELMPE